MPEYSYQSPVLYPDSFGIDHIMYLWTPGNWSMEGDDFSVRGESIPVLDINRKVITPGVSSKTKWIQDGSDNVYINARKSIVQKWVGSWGADSFMTTCMRDHLETLYTTQQGFWITFDDEMSYTGIELESVDDSYQYYLLPTYPIAFFRTVDITSQNLNQTGFFKLYKNGVAMENSDSPWMVDLESGLVYFSTAQLSTDIITIDYQWRLYCRISDISLYPVDLAQTAYEGAVEFEQLTPPKEVLRFDNVIFEGDPCVTCAGNRVIDGDGETYNDPPPEQDECAGWEVTTVTLDDLELVTSNANNWAIDDDGIWSKTTYSSSVLHLRKDSFDFPTNHVICGILAKKFIYENNINNFDTMNITLGIGEEDSPFNPNLGSLTKNNVSTDRIDHATSADIISGSDTTFGDTDKQYDEDVNFLTAAEINNGLDIGISHDTNINSVGTSNLKFDYRSDSIINHDTSFTTGLSAPTTSSGSTTKTLPVGNNQSTLFSGSWTYTKQAGGGTSSIPGTQWRSEVDIDGTLVLEVVRDGGTTAPEKVSVVVSGYVEIDNSFEMFGSGETLESNIAQVDVVGFRSLSTSITNSPDTTGGGSAGRYIYRKAFNETIDLYFDQDSLTATKNFTFTAYGLVDFNDTSASGALSTCNVSFAADYNPKDYLHELEINFYHREACDSGEQYSTTYQNISGYTMPRTGNGENGAEFYWTSSSALSTGAIRMTGQDMSRVAPSDAHFLGAVLTFEAKRSSTTGDLNARVSTQLGTSEDIWPNDLYATDISLTNEWTEYTIGDLFEYTFAFGSDRTWRWSDIDGVFPYFQVDNMNAGHKIHIRNVQIVAYFAQVVVGA